MDGETDKVTYRGGALPKKMNSFLKVACRVWETFLNEQKQPFTLYIQNNFMNHVFYVASKYS